jgi:2-oxoglutarate dehydrogenase E1 component
MGDWQEFQGVNAGYVLELYDRFRENPSSVDAATRAYFEHWTPPAEDVPASLAKGGELFLSVSGPASGALEVPGPQVGVCYPAGGTPMAIDKIVGAVNLAESIRKFGHLDAHVDPLGSAPTGDPSLLLETHSVTEDDLRQSPANLIVGPIAQDKANAWEVVQELRAVYSARSGWDYAHLRNPEEREWLKTSVESRLYRAPADPIDERALLERLTQVEAFERFLHRTFPGKTRFSIEGLDMLVPILDEVIGGAAEASFRNILVGMGHRGRLNVLAHVLNKPYVQIFAEFRDPLRARGFRDDALGWTGDVKYHLGARRAIKGGEQVELVVTMAPNASHLEAVDPVVEGMARAAGTRADIPGPPVFDPVHTLPVLIHGDAAFPGQGIVAETLNLYLLPGYTTGGTIHIVTNNQIGFTTNTEDARSTHFASDLARGFKIPIVRVNADDPEACIEAARVALAYRARFQKDFVIDLVGYRRYGHNEGDEPSFTQPLMYEKISQHPTVREIWAGTLVERRVVEPEWPEQLVRQDMEHLQSLLEAMRAERELVVSQPEPPPPGAARRTKTAIPAGRLRALNQGLLALPPDFALNRKLERARDRRRHALDSLDERNVEWAMAEELALASILEEGIAIRLTGQDVERGTFSQRHSVFFDVRTGASFVPLQALPQAKAAFEVHNSPLTENAVVGFEFGYNAQEPGRLVIWEAQYGDFINGAQTMIDEFIASARAKWGLTPSLVMLLPHGHEGQGPDHSSGRPERFLQLAAETDMRIANCTTAAQYFHLLRLQALLLETDPLPLVVLTPKSLLRHPLVASSLMELAEGRFERVIDDEQARRNPEQVRRVVLCSGKIYVNLVSAVQRKDSAPVALCRVEQLYPFPYEELQPVLDGYRSLEEVVWVQEEPENMGAWEFMKPHLEDLIHGRWPLSHIARPRNSSPAEGSSAWHAVNQEMLIKQAYQMVESRADEGVLLRKN